MKPDNDACLVTFLSASTDAEAWQALNALLTDEAGDVTRDTVTRRLARSRWMADHIDDVLGELRVKLAQKLWSMRAHVGEPIENFRAYCTTAAERTCYAFLRRQFPQRTRLRNRIRYAVTHHSSTVLEEERNRCFCSKRTADATRQRTARALKHFNRSVPLGDQ